MPAPDRIIIRKAMTIGIVVVASLAARVTCGPAVTMTSTLRRTSSDSASAGEISNFSIRIAPFKDDAFPLYIAQLAQALPERFMPACVGRRQSRQSGLQRSWDFLQLLRPS